MRSIGHEADHSISFIAHPGVALTLLVAIAIANAAASAVVAGAALALNPTVREVGGAVQSMQAASAIAAFATQWNRSTSIEPGQQHVAGLQLDV